MIITITTDNDDDGDAKAYSKPSETSIMMLFANINNDQKLDILRSSKFALCDTIKSVFQNILFVDNVKNF